MNSIFNFAIGRGFPAGFDGFLWKFFENVLSHHCANKRVEEKAFLFRVCNWESLEMLVREFSGLF